LTASHGSSTLVASFTFLTSSFLGIAMLGATLLVLSDTHALVATKAEPSGARRECSMGIELAVRAVRDAKRRGGFDAVVLLGDMLDAGGRPGAEEDAATLAAALSKAAGDVPRIVVPGNHDGAPEALLSAFDDWPGPHEVRGYCLYSFVDGWGEGDVCHRSADAMRRFEQDARGCARPLIVLQHNPLHPPIVSDYPYMLAERESVMAAYAKAGVMLSLSGHYHPGQPVTACGGVNYYTLPSLAESPFRYALVHLEGRKFTLEERALKLPDDLPLCDVHAHTHYAYCSEDVTPAESIRRARLFGLKGICLTEHSDQLYLTREEYTSLMVFRENDYWRSRRSDEAERMPRYRAEVEPLRDEYVKLGVEIETDGLGRPVLREEHSSGWDLRLGAVHWLPGVAGKAGTKEVKEAFMANVRALLDSGVDVLAHPFRFFRRGKAEPPRELYRPLARLLAERGTAAELNFHTNQPDAEFFAMCVEEGVKIALGSDAHNLLEVGEFHPHLELLRRAAGRSDVADLLFTRPWIGGRQ
jgi:histidinol phosphatase-like PHP family hydrolase